MVIPLRDEAPLRRLLTAVSPFARAQGATLDDEQGFSVLRIKLPGGPGEKPDTEMALCVGRGLFAIIQGEGLVSTWIADVVKPPVPGLAQQEAIRRGVARLAPQPAFFQQVQDVGAMFAGLHDALRGGLELLLEARTADDPDLARLRSLVDEALPLLPSAEELRQAGGIATVDLRVDAEGVTASGVNELPLAP